MARAYDDPNSLRLGRAEFSRLVVALLFSALLHLVIWGGYRAGEKEGWWQQWKWPAWMHLKARPFPMLAQVAHNEEPTIFVDVSHADSDAPQASKFYSNKNSRAANPDVANANLPKIGGTQTDMPKTEDAARPAHAASPAPQPEAKEHPADTAAQAKDTANDHKKIPELARLQPSLPPPSAAPDDKAENQAPQTPGETDLRSKRILSNPSPATTPSSASPSAAPARPRTLKQALAQRDQLPGQAMKQDGGVARHANWAALDVKSTPFGDYDRAIIEAVSQRWYDLLDSRRFAQDRSGKVILRFKLKPDGSIIEMQILENTVGDLLGYLCQEAIEEAAPFAKWPPDMARMIGTNTRDITFTFYYY